jgi:hypothetical protein
MTAGRVAAVLLGDKLGRVTCGSLDHDACLEYPSEIRDAQEEEQEQRQEQGELDERLAAEAAGRGPVRSLGR